MPKVVQFNVVLIRSGLTEWDRSARLVGQSDLPLDDQGLTEVSALAGGLDGTNLSAILHGPDLCSIGTAEAVARVTGGKLKKLPELHDVSLGLWEGLRTQEIEEKFPSAFREWRENPANVSVPEGEDLAEATERLVSAIGKSLEKLRNPDPGVGIVLRPMSYGLVRAWVTGEPVSQLWDLTASADHEWHEIARTRLRDARESAGVGS